MSKRQKRLQKLRQNPNNVTLQELERVLLDFGFVFKQAVGSHHTYYVIINGVTKLFVVPFQRPVKAVYVKKALKLIDQVIAQTTADVDEASEDEGEVDDD